MNLEGFFYIISNDLLDCVNLGLDGSQLPLYPLLLPNERLIRSYELVSPVRPVRAAAVREGVDGVDEVDDLDPCLNDVLELQFQIALAAGQYHIPGL
jgi:hypothetical protein